MDVRADLGVKVLEHKGSGVDGTYIAGHPSEKGPHKRDHKREDSKQDDSVIVFDSNQLK